MQSELTYVPPPPTSPLSLSSPPHYISTPLIALSQVQRNIEGLPHQRSDRRPTQPHSPHVHAKFYSLCFSYTYWHVSSCAYQVLLPLLLLYILSLDHSSSCNRFVVLLFSLSYLLLLLLLFIVIILIYFLYSHVRASSSFSLRTIRRWDSIGWKANVSFIKSERRSGSGARWWIEIISNVDPTTIYVRNYLISFMLVGHIIFFSFSFLLNIKTEYAIDTSKIYLIQRRSTPLTTTSATCYVQSLLQSLLQCCSWCPSIHW